MADQEIIKITDTGVGRPHHHHVTEERSPILYATLASVAIGGPLLGMMGFSLVASITILLITSPLLILFSPLLVPAALVLIIAMVGFGSAALLAIAGLHTFAWTYRHVVVLQGKRSSTSTSDDHGGLNIEDSGGGGVKITEMITESGQKVKEQVNAANRLVEVKQNQNQNPINTDDQKSKKKKLTN